MIFSISPGLGLGIKLSKLATEADISGCVLSDNVDPLRSSGSDMFG